MNKLDYLSEEKQIELVKQDGYTIKHIDNPSEKVQLEAVKQNGDAIRYIDNPSEEVQLEAVKIVGHAIYYIDNPSEEVQLEAVSQSSMAIEFIHGDICKEVRDIVDIIESEKAKTVYVLHEPNKRPLFSVGCQRNISKTRFLWRIFTENGGLIKNPHRKEYLKILKRY